MHRAFRSSPILAVVVGLGCAAVGDLRVMYPGPPRPESEVAVVECGGMVSNIFVHEIDGQKAPMDCEGAYLKSHKIHLLPGTHSFLVQFYEEGSQYQPRVISTGKRLYEYDLEAGRRYSLTGWSDGENWGARLQEKEAEEQTADAGH